MQSIISKWHKSLVLSPQVRNSFLICLIALPWTGCGKNSSVPAKKPPVESSVSKSKLTSFQFQTSRQFEALQVRYDNGESARQLSILESLGGGVGVVDFNRDGMQDFCFPGGGTLTGDQVRGLPSRLLRQQQGDQFADVTTAAHLDLAQHYSHACYVADYDQDGFDDLLITGYGGVRLWQNLGDGTFIDQTESTQFIDPQWSTAAAWGDYNGDGLLDVYLTHYVDWSFENNPPCNGPSGQADVCPPRQFEGVNDALYLCTAEGTFVPTTEEAGLISGGKGLGAISIDLDSDNDLDLYIANDTTPNFLYLNNGEGVFQEQGLLSGLALDDMGVPNGSMGVTVLDYNNDGQPDLGVSNYEGELYGLYQNSGEGVFEFTSRYTGINQIGNLYVGFGCLADDWDGDSDEDIVIANGHVVHFPLNSTLAQSPLLLAQDDDQNFSRIQPTDAGEYFSQKWVGRGLAKADVNDDGWMDLIFVNTNQPAALLYNESKSAHQNLQHVQVHLIGTTSNRNAIGAKLTFKTEATLQHRFLIGGGSYLSSSQQMALFHYQQDDPVEALTITWPTGEQTVISGDELPKTEEVLKLQVIEPKKVSEQLKTGWKQLP